ncbi:hypothetical protein TRFO_29073 [Tritrichomonas foetus]|uniref:Uncharacterized protein n=1 Tax=Tritrichomonas foetus TaxID=1144522 RepID=A0A1J4JWP4_9EUKA|nr:hypothetical protein TRFO_29073 [Tritrichomonas foetus]|eukprot:OHT03569.1 hypothetical protein TRFO_29073 [Tritrichomonas foetus]
MFDAPNRLFERVLIFGSFHFLAGFRGEMENELIHNKTLFLTSKRLQSLLYNVEEENMFSTKTEILDMFETNEIDSSLFAEHFFLVSKDRHHLILHYINIIRFIQNNSYLIDFENNYIWRIFREFPGNCKILYILYHLCNSLIISTDSLISKFKKIWKRRNITNKRPGKLFHCENDSYLLFFCWFAPLIQDKDPQLYEEIRNGSSSLPDYFNDVLPNHQNYAFEGKNHLEIARIVRDDDIYSFQKYVETNNINTSNPTIGNSFFECMSSNSLKKTYTSIQYAVVYNSRKILKYVILNNPNIDFEDLMSLAIEFSNVEFLHFLQQKNKLFMTNLPMCTFNMNIIQWLNEENFGGQLDDLLFQIAYNSGSIQIYEYAIERNMKNYCLFDCLKNNQTTLFQIESDIFQITVSNDDLLLIFMYECYDILKVIETKKMDFTNQKVQHILQRLLSHDNYIVTEELINRIHVKKIWPIKGETENALINAIDTKSYNFLDLYLNSGLFNDNYRISPSQQSYFSYLMTNSNYDALQLFYKYGYLESQNVPDSKGFYPIHLAIQMSNLSAIQFVIDKEINISQMYTRNHENALHLAVKSMNNVIIELLLNYSERIDINMGDYFGNTPLHLYCLNMGNSVTFLQFVHTNNININIQNIQKRTVLHVATAQNDIEKVKILLNLPSIDPNIKDSIGVIFFVLSNTIICCCKKL